MTSANIPLLWCCGDAAVIGGKNNNVLGMIELTEDTKNKMKVDELFSFNI